MKQTLLLIVLVSLVYPTSSQEKTAIRWGENSLKDSVKLIATTRLTALATDTSQALVQEFYYTQYSPQRLLLEKRRMSRDSVLVEVETFEYDNLQRLNKKTTTLPLGSHTETSVYIYNEDGKGGEHKQYRNDALVYEGEFMYPFDHYNRLPVRQEKYVEEEDKEVGFYNYTLKISKKADKDEVVMYDSSGNIEGSSVTTYDSKDRLIEHVEYEKGKLREYKAFSYDEKDRLIKETWKFKGEEGMYVTRYRYSKDDNMVERTFYVDDILSQQETYTYDKRGNWIQAVTTPAEEEIIIIKRHIEYYD